MMTIAESIDVIDLKTYFLTEVAALPSADNSSHPLIYPVVLHHPLHSTTLSTPLRRKGHEVTFYTGTNGTRKQ